MYVCTFCFKIITCSKTLKQTGVQSECMLRKVKSSFHIASYFFFFYRSSIYWVCAPFFCRYCIIQKIWTILLLILIIHYRLKKYIKKELFTTAFSTITTKPYYTKKNRIEFLCHRILHIFSKKFIFMYVFRH